MVPASAAMDRVQGTAVLAVLAGGRPDRMGFCGQDDRNPSTDGPPTDSGRPTDWGLVTLVWVEEPSAGVPESVGRGLPDDGDGTPMFLPAARRTPHDSRVVPPPALLHSFPGIPSFQFLLNGFTLSHSGLLTASRPIKYGWLAVRLLFTPIT